ncbi:DHH family phosphoesterase [Vallitalea okinawensis]|uniref:DHH family phosphoesterase n=1 Tax=Vallitalea okinawensis TaxID=2078660 RepID=UPI0014790CF3|nr:bifunctional oligoribonuclease/PAP phosphatase NrnA [Vallitalea okinawensis]
MNNFKEIYDYMMEYDQFILAGHISPDGDCIGATFALALALRKLGKEASIYLESFLPMYHYLDGHEMVMTELPSLGHEVVPIFLDSSDEGRLGLASEYLNQGIRTVNIDHHASNNFYADFNYVEKDASSTCEIIYNFIEFMGVICDGAISKAIFTGLVYDTGVFRHPNTKSSTLSIASKLLEHEIHASDIINGLFYTKSYPATQLLGQALEGISLHFNERIAISGLSLMDIEAKNGTVEDVDGIVQYIGQVDTVEGAVFLYEKEPGVIKVSLRSKKSLDVAKLALGFGGGGHIRAAGCTIKGTVDQAKEEIIKALEGFRSDF